MHKFLVALMPWFVAGATVAQACVDEIEPNDATASAQLVSCGARITGNLLAGEVDYYALPFGAAAHLRAWTSHGKLTTAATDTRLEIRDAFDVLLADDDDMGPGVYSYVGCNIATSGLYYLVVRGFGAASAGPYTLDILCEAPAIAEGAEPNNDPVALGVPTAGACGSLHTGFLTAGGDVDWISFVHTGGNVSVVSMPSGPDLGTPLECAIEDTSINVYNSASALVLADPEDDDAEGLNDMVNGVLPAGIYYVEIKAFDPLESGFYTVRIGCGDPLAILGETTPNVFAPAGCAGCAGVPTLRVRSSTVSGTGTRTRARLGTNISVDMINLPPGSLAFHVISLGLFPPVDLAILGAPGCFANVALDFTSLSVADGAGVTQSCQFIPYVQSYAGIPFYMQSASLDACHNAAGVATTNVINCVVGNVAFL